MPRGFRATDLLAILACLFVLLVAWLIPALGKAERKAARISCISNLKGIGLAFRIWANDNNDLYPTSPDHKDGTLRKEVLEGGVFRVFQTVYSNMGIPTFQVICPSDQRLPDTNGYSTNWNLIKNTNVSYFASLDAADSKPNMLLAGDRNIAIEGKLLSGAVALGTNSPVQWTSEVHRKNGNAAMADGSGQLLTTDGLRQQLRNSGDAKNLLVFPQ